MSGRANVRLQPRNHIVLLRLRGLDLLWHLSVVALVVPFHLDGLGLWPVQLRTAVRFLLQYVHLLLRMAVLAIVKIVIHVCPQTKY